MGRHPLQLYSLATPNGVKVTVMLEELLALGHAGAEYDAWLIHIQRGRPVRQRLRRRQPELQDPGAAGPQRADADPRVRVRRHPAVPGREVRRLRCPTRRGRRAECLSWLFWQMGSAPYLGGGFGHFYAYAPSKIEYAIDRFAMEVKRQLDVLDRRLAESAYLAGDDYTIADIAIWPWYGALAKGQLYEAGEFLQVQDYTHVLRWTDQIAAAPGGAARPHGQPHLGRAGQPAARAPRRQRLRHPDAGQAGDAELSPHTRSRRDPDHDHPLRLRHGAEPAPRAHPAGREGRARTTPCRSTCAPASNSARPIGRSTRSAPCPRCAPTRACC